MIGRRFTQTDLVRRKAMLAAAEVTHQKGGNHFRVVKIVEEERVERQTVHVNFGTWYRSTSTEVDVAELRYVLDFEVLTILAPPVDATDIYNADFVVRNWRRPGAF